MKEPIREIRIRIGKPGVRLDSEGEKILNFDEKRGNPELLRIEDEKENSGIENGSMADSELIRALMEIFARHSLYAYEREISRDFSRSAADIGSGSREKQWWSPDM